MTSSKSDALFTARITHGDLDAIEVRHPRFSARIFLQGAHLTHFAPTGDDNWLWMSPDAAFEQSRAIRGGIPVCWPWFGDARRNPEPVANRAQTDKAHGFARTHTWTLADIHESEQDVEISLMLDAANCGDIGNAWPLRARMTFRFNAEHCQILLTTHNTGSSPVEYTEALHTYFPTADVTHSFLSGLEQTHYIDTLHDWQEILESGDVRFRGETDRIYQRGGPILVHTPRHVTRIETQGSESTVVWNPGPEKAKRLSDFPDNAWKTMLCVETANAWPHFIRLMDGESHTTELVLSQC